MTFFFVLFGVSLVEFGETNILFLRLGVSFGVILDLKFDNFFIIRRGVLVVVGVVGVFGVAGVTGELSSVGISGVLNCVCVLDDVGVWFVFAFGIFGVDRTGYD